MARQASPPVSTLPEAYMVEHEAKGVLIDQWWDDQARGEYLGYVCRWSWKAPRSEAMRLESIEHARMVMSRIDPRVRRLACVRRWGSWSRVA